MQALNQLDERGLAGAGAPDQTDAFAGANLNREAIVERRIVPAIVERHIVEHDPAAFDLDRCGVNRIGNADFLVMDRHQLLHVVH
jgi:hypothetical protein